MKLIIIVLFFMFSNSMVFASNLTVLKDPNSVAPFNLCFIKNSEVVWPTTLTGTQTILFASPKQNFPVCLNQNLTIPAYKNLTLFQKNIFVAVAMWQSYFISTHPVNINVVINNRSLRFSGSGNPGTIERKTLQNGNTVHVVYPSALSTMLGQQGSPVDIVVTIKVAASTNYTQLVEHCVDPDPTSAHSACIPEHGRELTSVIIHELGHGYGIRSLRIRADGRANYGNFFRDRISTFDYATNNDAKHPAIQRKYADYFLNGNHKIVFTGPETVAYLKKIHQAPYLNICNIAKGEKEHSQNFSHLCNEDCANYPSGAQPVLMGLWCFWHGTSRLSIGSLDLHILADIGYKPVLKTMTEVKNLRATLFNQTI